MNLKHQTSDALRSACGAYLEFWGRSLPSEEDLTSVAPISERLEQRIEKLFQKEQKFYFYWINTAAKRVACILIILFLAAITTTFSVEALREPFIRFVVETFEKGSRLIFPVDSEEDSPIIATIPSYIPDGFGLTINGSDNYSTILHYEDSSRNTLSFLQFPKGAHMGINTEGVSYERIMILSLYEGIYFEKFSEGTLVFATDKYLYNISGALPKEELLKIAESIPFNGAS